jgi:peptidoglycan/LPS O-acetylase OafA/YrhL
MSGGLIVGTQHRVGWLHRVLTVRPLIEAGRLSYGMYVYHLILYRAIVAIKRHYTASAGRPPSNIVETFLYFAFAVFLVTGIAELSFRFIETPFLRLKRFFPSPAAPVS